MIYSEKIQKAIRFSIRTHDVYQKQLRKGKTISYITHPLTVGLMLARVGADEDVIAAGILHDTIEDSMNEKKVTKEMLAERFGERVADIVDSVTEQDKALPWEERKRGALEHIAHFSHDSLLVKSADVLSNTTELIYDIGERGHAVFDHFSASKERTLGHYARVIETILQKWPENPLAEDLRVVAKDLEAV